MVRTRFKYFVLSIALSTPAGSILEAAPAVATERPPSILVITVDALRADHLGCYGYERDTSPNIDLLVDGGVRFERAWTPEPLTGPAMCSMVTGLYPHQHAATRNGLRMQTGLDSLPKILARNGYATAAFVGTWTLKDNLTRLGEHFGTYGERLKRRRWFGIVNSEATGEDLTDDALEWVEEHRREKQTEPFFLWVHYIEPHAPYRFHNAYAERLGVNDDKLTRLDRYDTEIAAVDEAIGRLLAGIRQAEDEENLIVVFTADHGESLGEHNYWGHGRYLYEPSLRIPLSIIWKETIPPGTVPTQVTLLDLSPTLLALAGLELPADLPGADWSAGLRGGAHVAERVGCYQTHRGAVHGGTHDSESKRSKGLLWVGVVKGDHKEVMKVSRQLIQTYDLGADPGELDNLSSFDAGPSADLAACFARVTEGLGSFDQLAIEKLDEETVEQLRALGYLE